jgi:hypothetical protein
MDRRSESERAAARARVEAARARRYRNIAVLAAVVAAACAVLPLLISR